MKLHSMVLACLLLSAEARAAAILNVQFGNQNGTAYTGAAVVGTAGDYWNFLNHGNGTNVALEDSASDATSMTLTWQGGDATAPFDYGFEFTAYADLMAGYLYNTSLQVMNVDGLTPDTSYDLYIYTQGDSASDGREIQVSVNGGSDYSTGPTVSSASTFILGQNYLDIAVTSDGSGQLSIATTPTLEADINGFQLVQTDSATPEPSTLGLLAAGLAGMVWLKRRVPAR